MAEVKRIQQCSDEIERYQTKVTDDSFRSSSEVGYIADHLVFSGRRRLATIRRIWSEALGKHSAKPSLAVLCDQTDRI